MASAKQIAWRKKFARMSKAGKFKKSKKAKVTKVNSTTHKKTWKSNPHNPVDIAKDKLEDKYYIEKSSLGYATVHKKKNDKEVFYIPNLHEFTEELNIDYDDNGMILFMLDSSGVVELT